MFPSGELAEPTGWIGLDHDDSYTNGLAVVPRASTVCARKDPAGRGGLKAVKIPDQPKSSGACKGLSATHVGTECHRLFYGAQRGEMLAPMAPTRDFADDAACALQSWIQWLRQDCAAWVAWGLEYVIGSERLDVAGTVDALGILHRREWGSPKRAGLDWKTGAGKKGDHVKNAVYDLILRHEHGIEIEWWGCVYLNKSQPGYRVIGFDTNSDEWQEFRACALRKITGV